MHSPNPRIIVVDAEQKLHHLVRAAMELMGRRPRLIETFTADDALYELKLSAPDMLITAHTLGDTSDGPILALSAKREIAALPVIVLGNEDDPEMDAETISQSPFEYLRRPLAPEKFIRTLRIALDGPEAAPKEPALEQEIIPVPHLEYTEKIRSVLMRLLRDVGAMAIVLADRNGKIISREGAAGFVDTELIAAALAPGFTDTIKLLSVVGEQPRVLKHYDGERNSVFGLGLGLHHFLCVVFDHNAPATALASVKRYGGAAVNDILEGLGEVAFDTHPPLISHPHKAEAKRKTKTQEMKVVQSAAPAKGLDAPPTPTAPPEPALPKLEPISNFDPGLLDALDHVDLSQADALFDPDQLARQALALAGESRITFDDALTQGIIGDSDE